LQTAPENSKGQKEDMTPNHYLFMFLLKVGTCGYAHKIPALITKIQIKHKHNNKPNQASKVHTSSIDSTCGANVLFLLRVKIL